MTKKERNKIYRKALKVFNPDTGYRFLCTIFREILNDLQYPSSPVRLLLPEFGKYKPRKKFKDGTLKWWSDDEEGYKERKRVLKECIKLTDTNETYKRRKLSKRTSLSKSTKRSNRMANVGRRIQKTS